MKQIEEKSVIGRQLYELLPAVYRNRDTDTHLRKYLDACGSLLDRIRGTLDQRLADSFHGGSEAESPNQEWILPYLAQLLEARLLSPHAEGRREELSHAIAWRQSKGTLATLEDVVEAVAYTEVEMQEGFRRVAVTPRLDGVLLSAIALGAEADPDMTDPSQAARHPGLPAATVDFRYASRAVRADSENPAARAWTFVEDEVHWRHAEPFGVPCFPGSYEDVSRRTVDIRTPDWERGHHHPNRLLLFAPPPAGFFPPDLVETTWDMWAEGDSAALLTEGNDSENGDPELYRLYGAPWTPQSRKTKISDDQRGVVVTTNAELPAGFSRYLVENLVFDSVLTVAGGPVELRGVAAKKVIVTGSAGDEPILKAVDCLFDHVVVEDGLVQLEYCTVKESLLCKSLHASDCIFWGSATVTNLDGTFPSCVRYSRIPPDLPCTDDGLILCHKTTTDVPRFAKFKFCGPGGQEEAATNFGDPGYGVLGPDAPDSVCFGAEDGGEMGAYHSRRYCLQVRAALDKLRDFLPLGLEPVWIPDSRLRIAPPRSDPWIDEVIPASATAGDGPLEIEIRGAGITSVPGINTLTPDSATAGDEATEITIVGGSFLDGSDASPV